MPNLTRYHIDPGGAFHLGQRGVEQEQTRVFISADTLFAAMVAAWAEFGYEPSDLGGPFLPKNGQAVPATVPLLLTSAFPRAGEVYFYPALPLNRLNISPDRVEDRVKELKAIKFISEGIFKKVVAGDRLDGWLPNPRPESTDQGVYLQGKDLWLTVDEVTKLPDNLRLDQSKLKPRPRPYRALRYLDVWQVKKVPRVTVDRLTNSSNIYHTERLHFRPGCGFWFGIAWHQPDLTIGQTGQSMRTAMKLVLDLLADTGLGAERTAGYGHFDWEEAGTISYPDPAPGQLFVTLSRYHPRTEELPETLRDERAAYRLTSVGGWLQSEQNVAQRRRRLWMVEEGSIVRAVGRGPWGDVTDVRPVYERPDFPPPGDEEKFSHPIWRYGLACPVAFGGAL